MTRKIPVLRGALTMAYLAIFMFMMLYDSNKTIALALMVETIGALIVIFFCLLYPDFFEES